MSLSREETRALRERWEAADPDAAKRTTDVGVGRVVLAIIAGLNLIWGLIVWGIVDLSSARFYLTFALTFGALLPASLKWPLLSMATAAALQGLFWLAQMALDPAGAMSGILFRSLTLVALVGACGAVLRTRRAERDVRATARPPGDRP